MPTEFKYTGQNDLLLATTEHHDIQHWRWTERQKDREEELGLKFE